MGFKIFVSGNRLGKGSTILHQTLFQPSVPVNQAREPVSRAMFAPTQSLSNESQHQRVEAHPIEPAT
jgi:hypothetical protein